MLFRTISIASFVVLFQIHAISALSIATREKESVIEVKVDGAILKCELLPKRISAQDSESKNRVCYLVKPFKGSRAVLKSIEKQPDMVAYVEAEAGYTEKVGQYLYHSLTDDDTFFTLVLKDLRTGFLNPNRNATAAPERKLFHDWYMEDENMDVMKSLDELRESMYEQAVYHAETDGLLFLDLHFLNAFTDKTFYDTVFPDWAPSFDPLIFGVVPLPDDPAAKKERIEKFKQDLNYILSGSISIYNLKIFLEDHGHELRPADMPAWEADLAARKKAEAAYKAAQERWEKYQAEERDRLADSDYDSDSSSDSSSAVDDNDYGSD